MKALCNGSFSFFLFSTYFIHLDSVWAFTDSFHCWNFQFMVWNYIFWNGSRWCLFQVTSSIFWGQKRALQSSVVWALCEEHNQRTSVLNEKKFYYHSQEPKKEQLISTDLFLIMKKQCKYIEEKYLAYQIHIFFQNKVKLNLKVLKQKTHYFLCKLQYHSQRHPWTHGHCICFNWFKFIVLDSTPNMQNVCLIAAPSQGSEHVTEFQLLPCAKDD